MVDGINQSSNHKGLKKPYYFKHICCFVLMAIPLLRPRYTKVVISTIHEMHVG